MSDAITELQRIKRILIVEAVRLGDSHVCEMSVLNEVIDARIAELEAQQAEPSDAEIEAWRERCEHMMTAQEWERWVLDAVALMRRARGDQRLREAADYASKFLESVCVTETAVLDGVCVGKHMVIAALRAALGES